MLTADGKIVHIDFGFAFTTSPGGINFERAPFKLTKEYVDILGGKGSDLFCYFKVLLFKAFLIFKKPEHHVQINAILGVYEQYSNLKCFKKFCLSSFWKKFKIELSYQKVFVYMFVYIKSLIT